MSIRGGFVDNIQMNNIIITHSLTADLITAGFDLLDAHVPWRQSGAEWLLHVEIVHVHIVFPDHMSARISQQKMLNAGIERVQEMMT